MTNSINNTIRLEIGQNRDDLIIAAVIIIGLGFLAMAFAPFILVMLAAGLFLGIRIYKRMFYDSIYGKQGYFYMSLPVSIRALVISKLYAATLFALAIGIMTAAALMLFFWNISNTVSPGEIIDNMAAELIAPTKMRIAYAVLIMLVSCITETIAQMAAIFAVVTWYCSLPEKNQNTACKVIAVIAAAALLCALKPFTYLVAFDVLKGSVVLIIAEVVFQIIAAAALYRYIVATMNKCYIVR